MTNISQFIHDVQRVRIERKTHNNGKSKCQTLRILIIAENVEFTIDTFGDVAIQTEVADEIGTCG